MFAGVLVVGVVAVAVGVAVFRVVGVVVVGVALNAPVLGLNYPMTTVLSDLLVPTLTTVPLKCVPSLALDPCRFTFRFLFRIIALPFLI